MNRLLSCCIAVVLSFGFGMYAYGANLSATDGSFLQEAARASLFETEASKLAQEKADAPEVNAYAKLMLTDHEKMDAGLKKLADAKGFALPTVPDDARRKAIGELQRENGAEFDGQYVNDVAIDAHEEAVRLFAKAATQSDDADVKGFAAAMLPMLQSHLNRAHHLKKILAGQLSQSMPPVPQSVRRQEEQRGQPSKEPDPGSPEKAAESQ